MFSFLFRKNYRKLLKRKTKTLWSKQSERIIERWWLRQLQTWRSFVYKNQRMSEILAFSVRLLFYYTYFFCLPELSDKLEKLFIDCNLSQNLQVNSFDFHHNWIFNLNNHQVFHACFSLPHSDAVFVNGNCQKFKWHVSLLVLRSRIGLFSALLFLIQTWLCFFPYVLIVYGVESQQKSNKSMVDPCLNARRIGSVMIDGHKV